VLCLPTAEKAQINNIRNWIHNRPDVIHVNEQEYLDKGIDVVSLVYDNKSPIRRLLERMMPETISNVFKPKSKPGRVESEDTHYRDNQSFESAMRVLIIALGLGLLLGPMWWLESVKDDEKRLGIITGFVIFFAVIVQLGTSARPFELLGAVAA
jgi:hypothetical protein